MSADLYSSEIDEQKYGALMLEMSANGLLKLIVFDKDYPGESQAFYLPAKPEGWTEAEKLVSALQAWINLAKGR